MQAQSSHMKHIFSGVTLLFLLGAIKIGVGLPHEFKEYDLAKIHMHDSTASNALIAGTYEVLLERLAINNALLADAPASAEAQAEITQRRKAVTDRIPAALAVMEKAEFVNKTVLMADVRKALDKANTARAQADVALKLPKSARSAAAASTTFASLSELSEASRKLWINALEGTLHGEQDLLRFSLIQKTAWNLRDIAGFEQSHISQSIASKEQISPERLKAIAELRSQISLLWRFLQTKLQAQEEPALTQALVRAKAEYFDKYQTLAERMLKASADGTPYPMTTSQWVGTTTPQLLTLLEILHGAGLSSFAHFAGDVTDTYASLQLHLGLFALCLLGFLIAGFFALKFWKQPSAIEVEA